MIEPKNTSKSWTPLDPEDEASRNQFMETLKGAKIDEEIANEMATQLLETTKNNHNIIFVFTEGEYAVTAIHVPRESIDGRDGPVLMPGSNEKSIIAAFSAEFMRDKIKNVDLIEEGAGLPGVGDTAWVAELEKLVEIVKLELAANPPDNWDSLLEE